MPILSKKPLLITLAVFGFLSFLSFGYIYGQLTKDPYQPPAETVTAPPEEVDTVPLLISPCNFTYTTCKKTLPTPQYYVKKKASQSILLRDVRISTQNSQERIVLESDFTPEVPSYTLSYIEAIDALSYHYDLNPHIILTILQVQNNLTTLKSQGEAISSLEQTYLKESLSLHEGTLIQRIGLTLNQLKTYYDQYSQSMPPLLTTPYGQFETRETNPESLAIAKILSEILPSYKELSKAIDPTYQEGSNTFISMYTYFSTHNPTQPH